MSGHQGKGRPRHRYQWYSGVREWRCFICGKKQMIFTPGSLKP